MRTVRACRGLEGVSAATGRLLLQLTCAPVLLGLGLVITLGHDSQAQQPVVMVHGGNASGNTWSQLSYRLWQFGYKPFAPDLTPGDPIGQQASALGSLMEQDGDATPGVMVVAHSQGGLVSRSMARSRPVHALITVGTPHQGLPLGAYRRRIDDQLGWTSMDMVLASLAMDPYYSDPGNFPDLEGWVWAWSARWYSYQDALRGGALIFAGAAVFLNNFMDHMASWDEMVPGSSFLEELNANVGAEQIGHAFSIQAEYTNGYLGGPFALVLGGDESDRLGMQMFFTGFTLEEWAFELLSDLWNSPTMSADFAGAVGSLDLAFRLQTFGDWWSDDIVGAEGYAHDGIVPTPRQYRAGSTPLSVPFMPHTYETSADATNNLILQALNLNRP